MNSFARVLRGPAPSRLLARSGVDPKRYWILMDLFAAISDRGEMLDQLGRNGVALGTAALYYAIFSAPISLLAVIAQPAPAAYLGGFLVFTAFLFLAVLLSEAGNSLINPSEGLVLAHQPIDGATYTAAKLSHLLRIVFVLVPALDGIPAVAGLFLKRAPWHYPVLHLAAALAAGLAMALLCCAAFGWLMRFVPAKRLKAVGQFAGAIPFVAMPWIGQLVQSTTRVHWLSILPASPAARWSLAVAAALAASSVVALGIRSLSADYLIRVSEMMRGGAHGGARARSSWTGAFLARIAPGQPARAGFVYCSRLMRRDWQFRRQFLALAAPLLMANVPLFVKGWSVDPFSREFSTIHLLPHATGMLAFVICMLLPCGNDYKGAWIFHLAPPGSSSGFAAGIYAVVVEILAAVHLTVAPFLIWKWGFAHAALFLGFSAAAAQIYLAASTHLIDTIPFTKQPSPTRSAGGPLLVFGGLAVIGIAVAIQHYLLFRSPLAVLLTTLLLGVTGALAARAAIRSLAGTMRDQLAYESGAATPLYQEVEV